MPVIELTTTIKAPVTVCFDLARSIDLHKLSTAGTHEEAIAGVTSGLIGEDEQVTWRARHFGVTQCLTSRITAYDYPRHFRDEMVKGIFTMIRHDHYFKESGDETVMKDVFQFQSPFGVCGRLFNYIILTRYLKRFLKKRNEIIRQMAETPDGEKYLAEVYHPRS